LLYLYLTALGNWNMMLEVYSRIHVIYIYQIHSQVIVGVYSGYALFLAYMLGWEGNVATKVEKRNAPEFCI
jgi:hypothetical protein